MLAETPAGPEVYGTLVAPVGPVWRARILTYPNVLWVVPHGTSIKFVAPAPAAAEALAIAFIKDHCLRRGFKMGKEVPAVESGPIDLEQDERTARSEEVRASQRSLRAVRVRFGVGRTRREAETDDLSETGLFIRTDGPEPVGTTLQLFLETEGFGIPLSGVVQWVRARAEDGRPCGMGVKLSAPHPRYIHYCRQAAQGRSGAEQSATTEIAEWSAPGRPRRG